MSVEAIYSSREQQALHDATEIVRDATFPERVETDELAGALFATVATDELVRRILDSSDDFRAEHNKEIIAAARALLRRAGLDDTLV